MGGGGVEGGGWRVGGDQGTAIKNDITNYRYMTIKCRTELCAVSQLRVS